MQMPIALIVKADEPALFYRSVKDAEIDLEPYDVEAGIYTAAFGPLGEVYSISINDNRVIINRVSGQFDVEALRQVITGFLSAIDGQDSNYGDKSLNDLLRYCVPFIENI